MRLGTPVMSAAPPAMCNPFGDPPAIVTGTAQPDCLDGRMLGPWQDGNGNDRYACLWEPHRSGSKVRLPMVIYLHPSLFGPQTVAKTDLLRYQDSISLSADGTVGYIVLAPMGRKTLHHYPRPDEKGLGWDNWYRQLNPAGDATVSKTLYRPNVDAGAIDHFMREEVSTGRVDSERIYVMGWSNGAAMAWLYGLDRDNIAAAAVYSAPDPFGALNDPCPQIPHADPAVDDAQIEVFNPALATMHVHSSCDVAGLCPNAERMAKQVKAAGVAVRDVIIDYTQTEVNECTLSCGAAQSGVATPGADPLGYSVGFIEHSRWPKRWMPLMLDFLRSHPLKHRDRIYRRRGSA
jgi:poly(3-hydroxybutyrate) depolymerase